MKNPSKEQVKEWNRTYYLKNKVKRRDQYNKYRKELREWYRNLKLNLSCSLCKFSHPAVIAFHHKDPENKEYEISIMVNMGLSKETILKEMAKCDILCHNCHAIQHYKTP